MCEAEKLKLLESGIKPKLPKHFAWPVGVELLSAQLNGVSQYTNLRLRFSDSPYDHLPYRQMGGTTPWHAADRGIPQKVFCISYVTIGEPYWEISVYPVEARKRACVRELLKEFAFEKAKGWLEATRTELWLQRGHYLRFIWCRENDTMETEESDGSWAQNRYW